MRGEVLVQRALTIYPLNPQVWETLAFQMAQQGQWAQAASAFKAGYRLDRTWLEGAGYGIIAFVRAGMLDSATAFADTVGAAAPHDLHYLVARAEIAHAEHRPLEEMTWRRQVAWQFPDKWQYWQLTAEAALAAHSCWEARRSLGRVAALNPTLDSLPDLRRRLRDAGCER
jgi:predicted Zn-dependent protease